jgi:hypothetical protein
MMRPMIYALTQVITIAEIPDTLIIDRNVAVLWWPDSNEQAIMKENYDEISYRKFVDDMTWYSENAAQMLDSMKVGYKITDKDVIIFKNASQNNIVLKRKEVRGNMVLFNLNKDTMVTSMDNYNRKKVISFFK